MPKSVTVEIRCANIDCNSIERFQTEAVFAAPSRDLLHGWITVASAVTPGPRLDEEHLCPQCVAQLPEGARCALALLEKHARSLGGEPLQAPASSLATPADDSGADSSARLPVDGWTADNARAKLLALFDAAIEESGDDVAGAALMLAERFDATPDEDKREVLNAVTSAIIREINSLPRHFKAQIASVMALSLNKLPRKPVLRPVNGVA